MSPVLCNDDARASYSSSFFNFIFGFLCLFVSRSHATVFVQGYLDSFSIVNDKKGRLFKGPSPFKGLSE